MMGRSTHIPLMPTGLKRVNPKSTGLAKKPAQFRQIPIDPAKPFADIGLRLKWHRGLLGVDQAAFVAPLPSVKRTAYSNWEAGSTRLSLTGALEIRETYGLSLDFMYEGMADTLPSSLRADWRERLRVRYSR